MKGINLRMVSVKGIRINMHIAEKGEGPIILFLHGFPELWYSWRHQILALSSLGFHAVAPDLRGYGESEAPDLSSSYTCHHIVGDLIALIDNLGAEKVFVVVHDWGAIIGWYLCLFTPDRVKAFVCLSVPFSPGHPKIKPVDSMRLLFGDNYYICGFQKPEEIESKIERVGTVEVLKKIFTDKKAGPPCLSKENAFGIIPGNSIALPSWLNEAYLNYYVYLKKMYLDLNWELTAQWTGVAVKVPVKFVVGDEDMVYTTPGVKDYIHSSGFSYYAPLLEDVVVMEGVGHFINQERPKEINKLIYDFISKY